TYNNFPKGTVPGSGTNTATATWQVGDGDTNTSPNTAEVDFVKGTIVDESVTVTDPAAPIDVLPATLTFGDKNPTDFHYNYTVTATETGFTDSDWKVTGTITITNPNDWEAISANVSDALDNGGTCTIDSGTTLVVPAKIGATPGTKTANYTCTYTSKPTAS